MSDKNKKYPWIKRLFKKPEPVKCVYAGPEMIDPDFNKTSLEENDGGEKNKKPIFGKVYAGPEMREPEGVAVYAGPEYFENKDKENNAMYEDVYAGPEFFGMLSDEPEEELEEAEEPEEPEEDAVIPDAPSEEKKPAPFEGVYAGPRYPNRAADSGSEPCMPVYAGPEYFEKPKQVPPQMFMMVYAGPQFYNNSGGMQAPVPPQEVKKAAEADENDGKDGLFCPCCGVKVIENSKFCHECGTVLNNGK